MTQPAEGLFRSARRQLAPLGAVEARSVLCDAREHAAHAEAASLPDDDRKRILVAWDTLTRSSAIKQRMREERERVAALERSFRDGEGLSRPAGSAPSGASADTGSSDGRRSDPALMAEAVRFATRPTHSLPGAYHDAGVCTEEPEDLPQTRRDSRVSLNSGVDIALAGTLDRWASASTFSTQARSLSGHSTSTLSPSSTEVRGRSLGTAALEKGGNPNL